MEPVDPKTLNIRANQLLKKGRVEEAEARFHEFVQMFPDAIHGHYGLARCAQVRGDWELALTRWERVVEMAPDHQKALTNRANILLKKGRIEEAETQLQEIVAAFPDAVPARVGLARCAQCRGEQPLAVERWKQVIERAQDHQDALKNLANLLWKSGRVEEAHETFQKLVATDPCAAEGHAGLMMTARHQADWATALEAARSVMDRFEQNQPLFAQAAQTLVVALIRQGRVDEAGQTVERLKETALSKEDRVLLTAIWLQEQHRWMDCLAWYRKHETMLLANPSLAFRYMKAALWCGLPDEAYRLLKQTLRSKPDLQNRDRFQFITILERIGKKDVAVRWLSCLTARHGLSILSREMVLILATHFLEGRQTEKFFALARRINADESFTAHSISCQLAVRIYENLAWHLDQHHMLSHPVTGPASSGTEVTLWEHVDSSMRRLRRADRFQETCRILEEWKHQYRQLEERFSKDQVLVNTFSHPWECYRLIYFLIDRIRRRQATALIRLGDCEGNYLPYPEPYRSWQSLDRDTCNSHWWETKLDMEAMSRISADLVEAVREADVIGIPEPAQMILDLPVPTPRDLAAISNNWRGRLTALHHVTHVLPQDEVERLRPRLLTASLVNYDLELWGGYDLILSAALSCSVICHHPDVAAALRDRFGISLRRVILIPPEKKLAHRASPRAHESHHPAFFAELYRMLPVEEAGEVFLVAAGILGKSYCAWIKQRGGIALDVGSVLDVWCHTRTRKGSYHARADIGRAIRREALAPVRDPGFAYRRASSLHVPVRRTAATGSARKEHRPTHRQEAPADAFLDPRLSLDSCDTCIIGRAIKESLDQHLPLFRGTLLDVGSGCMPYKKHILKRNPGITRVIGLDFASGLYGDAHPPDLVWDGRTIPLSDDSVDNVMATEVLEHCEEPGRVLQEIRRVLQPDGVFFFTTPFLWPLHDAPHDHYRYTPFSLERLLREAGFEDIQIRSTGGWDASLAQMIGLWLRRAPMPDDRRALMSRKLFPVFRHLAESEHNGEPSSGGDVMSIGWSGSAYTPVTYEPEPDIEIDSNQNGLRLCLVRSVSFGYSETFIDDHIAYLSDRVDVLYGRPFPMFDVKGQCVLETGACEAIHRVRSQEDKQRLYTEALAPYLAAARFDVVLAEYGTNGAKVHEACRQAGIPCVVHFHGYDASQERVLRLYETKYRYMFSSAAYLVAVSHTMKDRLISLGAPVEKVRLNPCGVSVSLRDLARPEHAPPVFLAVGRFVEKKSPDLTIRSFARIAADVPDARLIMAGDGTLLSRCRDLVSRLGLEERVTFTGVLGRRSVGRLMRFSRAFVQHSRTAPDGSSEGMPVAVLEAGAAGLPVVSTRHAGIPDAVVEGEHGFLVDENDVAGMADAMLILATEPERAGQLGRNYRQRVVERFSRHRSIKTLRNILQEARRTTHHLEYRLT